MPALAQGGLWYSAPNQTSYLHVMGVSLLLGGRAGRWPIAGVRGRLRGKDERRQSQRLKSYSPVGPGHRWQVDTEGHCTVGCIGHCTVGHIGRRTAGYADRCTAGCTGRCTVVDRIPAALSVRWLRVESPRSPPGVVGGIGPEDPVVGSAEHERRPNWLVQFSACGTWCMRGGSQR